MTTTAPLTTTNPSLKDLAGAAKADRNRAVDAYRALAMLAVAVGHWAAIAVYLDGDGNLQAANAVELAPGLAWISWILQVMPLFFVVGGFSSAMSLDSHNSRGGRPSDWVAARLRRMMAPTVLLAGTWVVILVGGYSAGQGALVAAGATAAAIPLWFLANYTIDTAIAPYVLPLFRKNPAVVAGGGVALFGLIEVARFNHVPYLPEVNWVLGWLLFQVAGFAWRDGLLPTGGRLIAIAGSFWAAAVAVVAFGPYPVSMIHLGGLEHSPTHPPSLALMLFGAAYSATAIAFAPAVSNFLTRSPRAWAATVGANSMAMSVYLWHMTAAVGATAVFFALDQLPSGAVGTATWWAQKLPLMGLSALVLVGVVALVSRNERAALLAPRVAWRGGSASMLVTAAVVSTSVKVWTSGSVVGVAVGTLTLLLVWHVALKVGPQPASTDSAAQKRAASSSSSATRLPLTNTASSAVSSPSDATTSS